MCLRLERSDFGSVQPNLRISNLFISRGIANGQTQRALQSLIVPIRVANEI